MNRLIQSAMLIVAITSASVWAQGKIEMKLMQRYGGVLAPKCANYLLPQLKYLGDSLVVQDGGKAVLTGRNVKEAPRYFGTTPPPEFETALTSEVAGGEALVFVFYRNASGLFAAVEGGPKVMAALPAAFQGKRARHCDPNRNVAPGTGSPSAQAQADPNKFKGYALIELGASGLLYNPKAKATYHKALGPLSKEPWLAQLDGPSSENKAVKVAGADYVLISTCKNHDCFENSVVLLYSAAQDVVYGKVYQRGKSTLIGSPPPAVAAELEKLWKAEHRRGLETNEWGTMNDEWGEDEWGQTLRFPHESCGHGAIDRRAYLTSQHVPIRPGGFEFSQQLR